MKRRAFLRRLAAAVVGVTLARQLPGIAPSPVVLPPPLVVESGELGISRRFIRAFEIGDTIRVRLPQRYQ